MADVIDWRNEKNSDNRNITGGIPDVVYVVFVTTLFTWVYTISIDLKQYHRVFLETPRKTIIGLRLLNVPAEYRSGQHSNASQKGFQFDWCNENIRKGRTELHDISLEK